MKNPFRILQVTLVILAAAAISACEESGVPGMGTAEFSVSMPDDQLKSGSTGDSVLAAFQLMVSVEDLKGNPIFTDKLIPLYAFGTGFISEKIEMKTGEFKLVKFMVINSSGKVIYASPIAGSPLAYLTKKPLPLIFNVYPDRVTQVVPEVLAVGDNTPDKFGYASFGVSVIKPLAFWAGAVIDNPLILAPFPQFTEARLTVYATDGWHYTFKLFAGVNQLVIRGGSEIYSFVLEKEGYLPQKYQFKAAELLATTKEAPLYLKIPYDNVVYKTLVLQPGPDAGKDAMVSNLEPDKNFGGHKYFEATFITEPVLTVMRLNRSLIWFDTGELPANSVIKKAVLRLSYEVPIPWDSTIIKPASDSFVGGALQQITEPWEENAVTWNKQPASIESNQVLIPPFIRNVNFIDVDVTRLIVAVSTNTAANHGMKFKLIPEDKWPGFRFASSDHPNISLRPKLTIYYTN
jgi:hypothetical protein